VFLVVLAMGVMFAARLKLRPVGVLAGGVGAILLLIAVGQHFAGGGGGSVGGVLSAHQTQGIAHPLGAGSSFQGHLRATRIGILQAFKHPFGHGTGSVTIAANRYGHSRTVGTEFDPGNMGIAFGVPGLAVYAAFAWYAIKTSYRAAVYRYSAVSIFGLGLLMATLFQWTNGDLYSVCWLIWLFVGYLDMTMARVDAEAALLPAVTDDAPTWRRPGAPRHLDARG
jgi:hypothetical protein